MTNHEPLARPYLPNPGETHESNYLQGDMERFQQTGKEQASVEERDPDSPDRSVCASEEGGSRHFIEKRIGTRKINEKEKSMSMTPFVKDLRGYYGFVVVQPASLKETEWFYGMPIEDILENSEQPTGGLLRIDVQVRNNELEISYQRNGDYWVNAGRFFISDCNLEGDSAVVIPDVLSEITRMVVEDRDSLKKLWAKQRQGWESPEDPSELRQPVAEPDGEDPPPQKDVDGS